MIPDWLFHRTRGAIVSLSASTVLGVAGPEGAVRLSRRCSPFASHRGRAFFAQPLVPGLLLVNTRHAVSTYAVGAEYVREAAQVLDVGLDLSCAQDWRMCRVDVLAAQARPLVDVAQNAFGQDEHVHLSPVCSLYVLAPIVLRFDEDGRPIFLEPAADASAAGGA